ncbi:hypothetical protein [Vagococcus silagei]|nr:hypothetical protein [Vagococcus silagei]
MGQISYADQGVKDISEAKVGDYVMINGKLKYVSDVIISNDDQVYEDDTPQSLRAPFFIVDVVNTATAHFSYYPNNYYTYQGLRVKSLRELRYDNGYKKNI